MEMAKFLVDQLAGSKTIISASSYFRGDCKCVIHSREVRLTSVWESLSTKVAIAA